MNRRNPERAPEREARERDNDRGERARDSERAAQDRAKTADQAVMFANRLEKQYKHLDSCLAGRDLEMPVSVFNAPDGLAALERLVTLARGRYRMVVISFGATTHSAEEVLGVVRGVLPEARRVPVSYRWSVACGTTTHKASEKEVLIVAPGEV